MGNLNSWQKISRIFSGLPFGNGVAGPATISADPNTRTTLTGTADSPNATVGDTSLQNGDMVYIIQPQGSGHGKHEINRVASGGGTTSVVMTKPLKNTYSGAQAIKFTMNSVVTVNAFNITGWDGAKGGISVICGRDSITLNGSPNAKGYGFRGGSSSGGNGQKPSGEGTAGTYASQYTPNGNGGGGGDVINSVTSGGGGGHIAGGTVGHTGSGSGIAGQGGDVAGDTSDGVLVDMGGGGGGSGRDIGGSLSAGAIGGGILVLISKNIIQNAGCKADGNNSGAASDASGGAGAGGAIIYICQTATLGSGLSTAIGGTNGGGSNPGGNGGDGFIAVHHSGTVTGSTSPALTDVSDTSLVEAVNGMLPLL